MPKTTILKPRLSEKAYATSEAENTYVFDIPARANREAVKRAVAAHYDVQVETVRLAKTASKTRRSYKRRGRVSHRGETSAVRKAYVTLKEGDKLPLFAVVEEADKKTKEKK